MTRRTRIVCTLGPATESREAILELARAGMDVARLNFSHGDRAWHAERCRVVRDVATELGRPIAVLQDLPGPKLRLGPLPRSGIRLVAGEPCMLSTAPGGEGGSPRLPVPHPEVLAALSAGQHVYLGDGQIDLLVEGVSGSEARCCVMSGGTARGRMGLNVPYVHAAIEAVTEKDRAAMAAGAEFGVDWVAISFVRSAADVTAARDYLTGLGTDTPLIAKIEKPEALPHLAEIAEAADGLMAARGDLGVELPLSHVPLAQKEIIGAANDLGKPVITATQMLESMIQSPRPTRAEASDVANAILDGTDALMLSAETAIGRFPAVTVKTMAEIAEAVEPHPEYERPRVSRRSEAQATVTEAVAEGACNIAADVNAAAILCSTTSGATARALARLRPRPPLIAATPDDRVRRQLCLTWGIRSLLVPRTTHTDERIAAAVDGALAAGWIRPGDRVVIAAGTGIGTAGHTDLVRVQTA